MLYKFKSAVTSDIIMLEANGQQVLRIIGKGDDLIKGIVTTAQIPAAIAAMEAAVVVDDAAREQARATGNPPGGISLRQRTLPLLDALRRCQQAQEQLVWGV